jgi:DsbC/DsbD-like thiol-disulfide interchange protein
VFHAAQVSADRAKNRFELISNSERVQPGKEFYLGIRLMPATGYHTYWTNPGDSGGPSRFKLDLPEGWIQKSPIWPAPKRLDLSGTISYGYDTEVLVVIPVQSAATTKGNAINISGKVDWLTCTNEMCVPANGRASLTLFLGTPAPSKWNALFAKALADAPKAERPGYARATSTANGINLSVANVVAGPSPAQYYFFPAESGVIDHSKPERFYFKGTTLIGELPKSPYAQTVPKHVTGLLVTQRGSVRDAVSIDVPLEPIR